MGVGDVGRGKQPCVGPASSVSPRCALAVPGGRGSLAEGAAVFPGGTTRSVRPGPAYPACVATRK